MPVRVREWLKKAVVMAGGPQARRGALVLLKDLDVARSFPVQTPLDVVAPRRRDAPPCLRCGGAMREVHITTGGPGCDMSVWEAHPLSVDGWHCPACSEVCLPRALEPAEAVTALDSAILHARALRLDEAELSLRRVTSSWPRYAPARLQLATLYAQRLARADALHKEGTGGGAELRARLAVEIVVQLDDLLEILDEVDDSDGRPTAGIRRAEVTALLARALLRVDDLVGALARVDRQLARPGLSVEDRDVLEGLRAWIGERGDLLDDEARARDVAA